MDSTSSSKSVPNQTVIDNNEDASNIKGEAAEVSSLKSATNKSRKELSVAKSRPLRQIQVELMEHENLMAKQQAEQQLRDCQIQLKNEPELKLQQPEEELRLQQRKQELCT